MDVTELELIAQGNTAEVYALGDKVLKLFRSAYSRESVRYEYEQAKMVQAHFVKTPQVFDLIEMEGRFGITYERIDGGSMLLAILQSAAGIDQYAEDLVKLHLEMHKNQLEIDAGLRVKDKLTADIEQVHDLSDAIKTRVIKRLPALPDGQSLCHFDFHPDNIILTADGPVIIDWVTVCIGDPCADVARTYLLIRYAKPKHADSDQQDELRSAQEYFAETYLKFYLKGAGIRREAVEQWLLPVATARLSEEIHIDERAIIRRLIQSLL